MNFDPFLISSVFAVCLVSCKEGERADFAQDDPGKMARVVESRDDLEIPVIHGERRQDRFWAESARLGNALSQGGKIYFQVVYKIGPAAKQDLIEELHRYLIDPWIGRKEIGPVGHVRIRDEAACILADLIGVQFPIDPVEHPYARDRRIAALVDAVNPMNPNGTD